MKNKKITYYITIVIMMIIIGIILILYGLMLENSIVPIYNYKIEKNSDYKVLLKPNNFYLENVLPSGGYYASNSIDLYKIDFNYLFEGEKKAFIKYNYNITAKLIGIIEDNEEEKEVWNRNFNLFDNIEKDVEETSQFEIKEKIDIDYKYYNNLVRLYEQEYKITIKSVLKIYLNISYTIDLKNYNANNENIEDSIELEIPLTNSVSEIKENYEKNIENCINSQKNNLRLYKKIFVIISGIFIICSAILIIVIKFQNRKTPEEKYKNKLNQILKYYKDIIITVTNKPDISNLKIIEVSYIEDLIDIAEQTRNNIIYYPNIVEKESEFYIINDNYVYIYKLKNKNNKYYK